MGCKPGPPRSGRRDGLLAHAIPKSLELAAPHVFQIGAIGPGRRSLVKENGNAEPPPDFQAGLTRQQHALLKLDPRNGDEWNHSAAPMRG